jgi:hypothetical protein
MFLLSGIATFLDIWGSLCKRKVFDDHFDIYNFYLTFNEGSDSENLWHYRITHLHHTTKDLVVSCQVDIWKFYQSVWTVLKVETEKLLFFLSVSDSSDSSIWCRDQRWVF